MHLNQNITPPTTIFVKNQYIVSVTCYLIDKQDREEETFKNTSRTMNTFNAYWRLSSTSESFGKHQWRRARKAERKYMSFCLQLHVDIRFISLSYRFVRFFLILGARNDKYIIFLTAQSGFLGNQKNYN